MDIIMVCPQRGSDVWPERETAAERKSCSSNHPGYQGSAGGFDFQERLMGSRLTVNSNSRIQMTYRKLLT